MFLADPRILGDSYRPLTGLALAPGANVLAWHKAMHASTSLIIQLAHNLAHALDILFMA